MNFKSGSYFTRATGARIPEALAPGFGHGAKYAPGLLISYYE